MPAHLTRRTFAWGGIAAALLLSPPSALAALNTETARKLIDQVIGDINAVINSGMPEEQMYREFERIFRKYADTSYVAAYGMGVAARRATPDQKKRFKEAFIRYLSRKYGKRFREFIGARLEVTEVRQIRNFYEVRTIAYLPGEAPFEVAFHVSDRTGRNLFFNMYVEGVNMLLTEREEIGAILDKYRGDIDKMIAELENYR